MANNTYYVYDGDLVQYIYIGDYYLYQNIIVYSGGTANGIGVYDAGEIAVFSGGLANDTDVYDTGEITVFSDGLANSTTVYTYGKMTVSSGGTANDSIIAGNYSSGGVMYVDGGNVNGTTVRDVASLYVYNGGVANDTTIMQYGRIYIYDGGVANRMTTHYSSNYNITVENGGTVNSSILYNGTLFISSGGTVNSTEVVNAYVYDGGVANDIIITSTFGFFTDFIVYSGGTANNIEINNGNHYGLLFSNWGGTYVSDGGIVNGVRINSTGAMFISSGGTAMSIKENGGYVAYEDGANVSFVPNTFSGLVLHSNHCTIHSGTTANSTTLRDACELVVLSDGKADNTILDGGLTRMYVASGGTANNTIVSTCRSDSGVAGFHVQNGGIANGTTVEYYGAMYISSGGTAVEIKENGGYVEYEAGANVSFVPNTFSGLVFSYSWPLKNFVTLHSGTTAVSTTLNSACHMIVCGGIANNTTVNSSGYMYVSSGGTANSTTVDYDGYLEVSSGGTASIAFNPWQGTIVSSAGATITYLERDAKIYYGYVKIYNGEWRKGLFSKADVMESLIVESGQSTIVYSGGTANSTTVNYYGSMTIDSGGTANNTTVNSGGSLILYNGGIANGTTVNSGVRVYVPKSGTANSTTVNYYGSMTIDSGGKVTGQTTIASGAVVSASKGAIFDFDISELAPEAAARINDLSRVSGWSGAVYTLTVNGSQANGTYTLADGATGFNKTVSIVNTAGTNIGTLKVGETAKVNGADYTLNLNGGMLSVEVVSSVVPVPDWTFFTGDFNGDGKAMLAVETPEVPGVLPGTVTIYQNGEAWGLGLTLDPGWNVVGTGDFNADGRDDFLRVNEEGYVVGEMANDNGTFSPQVLNMKGPGWDILGTGDFNGNGSGDVLVANPTGASNTVGLLGYWEGGVTWTLINGYSPEWECVSTGDFNGDGKCDMLWRNSFIGEGGLTYNAYCTWIVDNPVDWRMVSVANPDEWIILCSGDFDGNGSHDIAMINDVGVVGIWVVGDGYLNSWSILSAVNTAEWTLAGVGDFNADGTDDIAWASDALNLAGYWQINDKQLTTWSNIANLA